MDPRRTQTARPRRPHGLGALLALLALLVGLSACADAPEEDGAGQGQGRKADEQAAADSSAAGGSAAPGSDTVEQAASAYGAVPDGAMVARDAEVDLAVEELEPAASRVRAAAVAVAGYLLSEELQPRADGPGGHATLVLSVPSPRLDRALEQVAEVGTERGRRVWSEDVTADYVDSSARVETLRASVERTRRLMQQAESIEDIVALERELARREADLDALTAHVDALEDDVARSTLTVHLSVVDETGAPTEPAPAGFVAGLDQGWAAFTLFATGALTVLGASLPFLLLGLVVVLPVALLLRRRRARG